MRHALVFAAIFLALVALWLYQDRREIAWRAAGVRRVDPTLAGCASLLLAGGVYAAVVLWSSNALLALLAAVATPLLLTFGAVIVRALLSMAAPTWFPEPPPPEPVRSSSSGNVADSRPPALAETAFGRPAPAFEKVGTWLSSRGNCRNTAWAPAVGPGAPRLAWQWNVAPAPPEYLYSIHGAPAVDHDGRAYVATSHGLVAFDSEGKRLWSLGEHRAALPALDPIGKVVSGYTDRILVASPAGEASWLDCPGLDPVAVTVAEDGALFVANRGGVDFDSARMTALDLAGAVRWSVSCLRRLEYPPAVSPTGTAYCSSQDSIVWNSEDPSAGYDRYQAVSASGSEIERVDANDEGYSQVWGTTAAMCLEDGTPVVGIGEAIRIGSGAIPLRAGGTMAIEPGGTLYVACGSVIAFDLRDGRQKWRLKLDGADLPIVDGEGTVYAAGRGSVVAITPGGETLWSWELPRDESGRTGIVQGLAIGPDRTLYVATQRTLYALRS